MWRVQDRARGSRITEWYTSMIDVRHFAFVPRILPFEEKQGWLGAVVRVQGHLVPCAPGGGGGASAGQVVGGGGVSGFRGPKCT